MKTLICTLLGICLAGAVSRAQTSAFTYQGRLNNGGVPANNNFDMVFSLHDTPYGQSDLVGTPITNAPVAVSNGLFIVTLDFGAAVYNGGYLWLQVGVRTNGSTSPYALLSPLQPINSAPYAVQALNAGTAATAITADTATNLAGTLMATNLTGTIPVSLLPTNVAFLNGNVAFAGSVTATNFIGKGLGLTAVPTAALMGSIADSQLSSNVALQSGSVSFNGTVSATNFNGTGTGLTNVPGRIYPTVPTGAAIQAQPNTGYLATNQTSIVTVTLPVNPQAGDTVRVSGGAAAGWILLQNAGQSIVTAGSPNNIGLTWNLRETNRNWTAIASSSDGQTLVATATSQPIFVSTNAGNSWMSNGLTLSWVAAAASGNGSLLAAVANSGQVYLSTNYGAAWNPYGPSQVWSSIASSVDGTHLVAVGNPGYIYLSSNSGSTWTAVSGSTGNWTGVASSASGSNLVACITGSQIYNSTNSGVTWFVRDSIRAWTSVAMSADGSTAYATVANGMVYVSNDSGTTWAPTATSQYWTSTACSGGGRSAIAVYTTGGISTSTDGGRSWVATPAANVGSVAWTGTTFSGDGSTVAAVGTGVPIYVYSQGSSMTGTNGYMTGTKLSAVELEYIGNGQFMPISQIGTVQVH